ncbi:MAG: hypothetical protein U0R66_02645 [Mycobacterium sp.]
MVIDGVVGVDSAPALSAGAGMDAEVAAPGTGIARGGAAAAVRGGETVLLRAGNTAAGFTVESWPRAGVGRFLAFAGLRAGPADADEPVFAASVCDESAEATSAE